MLRRLAFSLCLCGAVFSSPSVHAFAALEKVQVPEKLLKRLKGFEPSSALYLPDLDRYVISSDDTDKNETPFLFLMNNQGQVDENPLKVQGLQSMTDIESMSTDGHGLLYLLSSLSINKSGVNKVSRNLLAQVKRQGSSLVLNKKIELRSLLVSAIKNSSLPELAAIAPTVEAELDIESHLLWNGELLVGLKKPQPRPNEALILNLGRMEDLLRNERIDDVSVWKAVDFSEAGTECLLSDLQVSGEELYLSTTSDIAEPGHLWHMGVSENTPRRFDSFPRVKPEGLALRAKDNKLMIVFDQGLEPALFHMRPRL